MSVTEQVAGYRQYRDSLVNVLQSHPVWLKAGDEAQAMTAEGVEYMTMNQIYQKYARCFFIYFNVLKRAFSPKNSDDSDRDDAAGKKMSLYTWLEPRHLDLNIELDEAALKRAGEEFGKADEYTTPRDKMICFMNGIRIISRSLGKNNHTVNADLLMPAVILTLVRARPKRLHSNLQFISRFRSPALLNGQPAYNLTSLIAAAVFVEKLDKNALLIEEAEYNKQMEDAVARFNAESVLRQEEVEQEHQEEMARRETKMMQDDQAEREFKRGEERNVKRSPSTEFRALLGDLEENGTKIMQRVRESSIVQQSRGMFSEFMTEAKSVVKGLVDDSDDEEEEVKKESRLRSLAEEEEYQMQLALAISLSEVEGLNSKGKEKIDAGSGSGN